MNWVSLAAKLSGQALHVGMALWFLGGMGKSASVKLSNKAMKIFGVDRYAKGRGLKALENAGLVSVEYQAGCSPMVKILDVGRGK